MIRVGVVGAGGRMGATVAAAVANDPDLQLVALVDPAGVGQATHGLTIGSDVAALVDAGAEVAVDFTVAAAARQNLPVLAAAGVHSVVGTTGLDAADLDILRAAFAAGGANCLVAANFAVSAVLMQRFAELAAPFFATAEIIELHHDAKVDAPSGTAIVTAERIAAASPDWEADRTQVVKMAGARGGLGPAGIRVHSVRMRGMVAHQEVILGAEGQTLTIRQDSYDRSSFMPGVIRAVKGIAALPGPGLTTGLEAILGI